MTIDDEADEAEEADVGSGKVRLKDAKRRLRNLETKGRGFCNSKEQRGQFNSFKCVS